MNEDNVLRRRKPEVIQNGQTHHDKRLVSKFITEFRPRESILTVMFESSPHIRAMYNIFVVILVMLLFDTVIFDLVEHGKINLSLRTVVGAFGDVGRGIRLWLFDFAVALLFYPCLRIFGVVAGLLRNNKSILWAWCCIGIAGLVGAQALIICVPTWKLAHEHLAVASAAAVTLEMFRLSMKIQAVAMVCGPRCVDGSKPLPSLKHYIYFLFAPTLIYRDQYPRTKSIRWSVVIFHFLEVAGIVFYDSFLWERFILPYWSDYGKETQIEAGVVVRNMFACVLPGVLAFLCGFYGILHAWLNAFAEMLTFSDKLFYEEWWTKSQFSQYYRAWNLVVYSWLREHIYIPLSPATGRGMATFIVFLISSIAHEMVLALSFGFFYPVLLVMFGALGLICVPLTANIGRRFPNGLNLLIWLGLFIGNGMLWSLYPMEYFARMNCPPSPSDSFYIPKSWTCPQIILKPDWTFHNPLNYLFKYFSK